MAFVTYGCEGKRMDLDTQSSDILLFEFSRQMTLHEGCLHLRMSARIQRTQVAPAEQKKEFLCGVSYQEGQSLLKPTLKLEESDD